MISVRYVIRNGITGAYIHKSSLKILDFNTYSKAQTYIRQKGLNTNVYFVEEIK